MHIAQKTELVFCRPFMKKKIATLSGSMKNSIENKITIRSKADIPFPHCPIMYTGYQVTRTGQNTTSGLSHQRRWGRRNTNQFSISPHSNPIARSSAALLTNGLLKSDAVVQDLLDGSPEGFNLLSRNPSTRLVS